MPLFNPDGTRITDMPIRRRANYARWREGLSDGEYQAIVADLNHRVDGQEVVYSSYLGAECLVKPIFGPVRRVAHNHAGLFFGLLLYEVMMNREENRQIEKHTRGKRYRRIP